MPDFDKLQKDVSQLNALLQDRQEGISSWCLMVAERWQSIAEAWGGTTLHAPDGAKAAATLSGLYNCYVCGEEKCTEEQKLYLCKDCANGIVNEVVGLIQDNRPAGNA